MKVTADILKLSRGVVDLFERGSREPTELCLIMNARFFLKGSIARSHWLLRTEIIPFFRRISL